MTMDSDNHEYSKLWELVHRIDVDVAVLKQARVDAEKALELAAIALRHAQDASNEWRKENIDQRALFMTEDKTRGLLAEEASERRAIEGRVTLLEKGNATGVGRHSAFDDVWLKLTVIATLLMTAVSLAYKFMTGK